VAVQNVSLVNVIRVRRETMVGVLQKSIT